MRVINVDFDQAILKSLYCKVLYQLIFAEMVALVVNATAFQIKLTHGDSQLPEVTYFTFFGKSIFEFFFFFVNGNYYFCENMSIVMFTLCETLSLHRSGKFDLWDVFSLVKVDHATQLR